MLERKEDKMPERKTNLAIILREISTKEELEESLRKLTEAELRQKSSELRRAVDNNRYSTALHIAEEAGLTGQLITYLAERAGEGNLEELEETLKREFPEKTEAVDLKEEDNGLKERVKATYRIIRSMPYEGLNPLIKETISMCFEAGRYETMVFLAEKAGLTEELELTHLADTLKQIAANERIGSLSSMNRALLLAELRWGGILRIWVRFEELVRKRDELKELHQQYEDCKRKEHYMSAIRLAKQLGFTEEIGELVDSALNELKKKRYGVATEDDFEYITDETHKKYFRVKDYLEMASELIKLGMIDEAKQTFEFAKEDVKDTEEKPHMSSSFRYRLHLDIAYAQLEAKMNNEAEKTLELAEQEVETLTFTIDKVEAYCSIAYLQAELGKRKKAKKNT